MLLLLRNELGRGNMVRALFLFLQVRSMRVKVRRTICSRFSRDSTVDIFPSSALFLLAFGK
jgi:hypothetical protein